MERPRMADTKRRSGRVGWTPICKIFAWIYVNPATFKKKWIGFPRFLKALGAATGFAMSRRHRWVNTIVRFASGLDMPVFWNLCPKSHACLTVAVAKANDNKQPKATFCVTTNHNRKYHFWECLTRPNLKPSMFDPLFIVTITSAFQCLIDVFKNWYHPLRFK